MKFASPTLGERLRAVAIAGCLASCGGLQPLALDVEAGWPLEVTSLRVAESDREDDGADAENGDDDKGALSPRAVLEQALVFDLPEPKLEGRDGMALWATYYYVPTVDHAARGFDLRDMGGKSLGVKLSRRNWCEAAMQGTVLITRKGVSATFNYAGTKKNTEVDCTPVYPKHPAIGRTRFTLARGPYGDGVRGMALIPFRSIAVDPGTVPFGSLVYIPAARGTTLSLPDGTTAKHDGYFFAADRGGAIKKTHIDVFVGVGKNNPFAFVKSKSKATFDAHVIASNDAAEAFERLRAGHEAFK